MSSNEAQGIPHQSPARAPAASRLPVAHPILIPIVLHLIAFILRILDVNVFGLAERWGEALLHKSLGFVILLIYLWLVGASLRDIGLHGRLADRSMLIAVLAALPVFFVGYALQMSSSRSAGQEPSLVLTSIDPRRAWPAA